MDRIVDSLKLSVRFRWWVRPYFNSMAFFCKVTGMEPDFHKIAKFVCAHGVVLEVSDG